MKIEFSYETEGGFENPEHEAFFREFWDLCQKHGAKLDGCGCCESPAFSFGPIEYGTVVTSPEGVSIRTVYKEEDRNE